jgi:choline dehydrogenase-like flavoprotein
MGTSFNDSQPLGISQDETYQIPINGVHEQEPHPSSHTRAKTRCYTDGRTERAFPRLSKPVELLRSSYDVVVIGSGYGGGVAASRMARTGQSVCLLERGREKWPGEYPTGSLEAAKELHCSGTLAPGVLPGKGVESGDPTGMYHMIFGRGQSAIVCNGKLVPLIPKSYVLETLTVPVGLGGTSLMNANVFMEADKETLAMKVWPPEIRNNVDGLDKCESSSSIVSHCPFQGIDRFAHASPLPSRLPESSRST